MLKMLLPFVAALASVVVGQAKKPALAAASNAFACDLYRKLASTKGNLFFSPYSISSALAMTRAGAVGTTATQMDAVLHTRGLELEKGHRELTIALAPPKSRKRRGPKRKTLNAYDLRIANALFGQKGFPFEDSFASSLDKSFGAPLQRIDFRQTKRARELINDWVADHTNARIKDLVPEGLPMPDTRLALVNAIYFKADWDNTFMTSATRQASFTRSPDDRIQVRMMHRISHMKYGATEDALVVEIPYDRNETSMLVVLPKKRGNLKAIESKLTSKVIAEWRSSLRGNRVQLKLPRFKFTSKTNLTETLPAMGMKDAFDPGRADFSPMTKAEPLFIGAVLHEAFIAVDEDGTEATGATVVMMMPTGIAPRQAKPVPFIADHPFLFLIQHRKTGCILFAGRVTTPTVVTKKKK
jgi:serpin B